MPSSKNVLVAEDDRSTRELISKTLAKHGFIVQPCIDGFEALAAIESSAVDLVIADYQMPKMDGLELLKTASDAGHIIPFIIITAHGGFDSTISAMELGAVAYLTKPVEPIPLVIEVKKALNFGSIQRELNYLQKEVQKKYRFDNIIGKSQPMQNVYDYIHKASASNANVLITGESGTGKELVARAIHYSGLRKNGPFIAVNCSVFSKGTLESELFGHVKGAFTDAVKDRKGRFELADQGTLFIDEIGEIPSDIQVKLLRVLQEKQLERVGGEETISSDFRLIAATNKNLKDLIESKEFREDLYYRLNVINISMPPLRERKEDIPDLLKYFLDAFNQAYGKNIKTFSIEALKIFQEHPWPGNIRQLENAVESSVALCDGDMIHTRHLPLELTSLSTEDTNFRELNFQSLPEAVEVLEKEMIQRSLKQYNSVKAHAAKALGINERVLSYKMTKYNISAFN